MPAKVNSPEILDRHKMKTRLTITHSKKPLVIVNAIVLSVASLLGGPNVQGAEDPIAWMRKGVVKITASPQENISKVGSGIIIGQDPSSIYIVTASHVVRGDSHPTVEFFPQVGRPFQAKVLISEVQADTNGIAVVRVSEELSRVPEIVVLGLDKRPHFQPASPILMIGHPRIIGVPWAITKGEIIGQVERSIRFSGLVEEGNSGGPLIFDGKILGVITGTFREFSEAVPVEIVKLVLDGWSIPMSVTLRSQSGTVASSSIARMVREKGFHHPADLSDVGLSPSHVGMFRHHYLTKKIANDLIIVDRTTNLMWQRDGSITAVPYERIDKQIERLNQQQFGGYADWRLPTIEELASLIEPFGMNEGLFIDRTFQPLPVVWSGDHVAFDDQTDHKIYEVLMVSFRYGGINWHAVGMGATSMLSEGFVRGVRSLQPGEYEAIFGETIADPLQTD